MEFHLSYFKSWKMVLWKCCTQYASKFGKLSSGHRTGKGQLSFQSQRKAMPKNAQTTTQLHSSHMLVKLKILQAKLQQYMNHELPDVQASFRKGRGTRDQIANIIEKAREVHQCCMLLTCTWGTELNGDECNCVVVWIFFGIAFLWDWNENWPFPVLWLLLSFPNLLAYWV